MASNTLFRNKMFALNEMFQRNASKFAIFYVEQNLSSFLRLSFRATLYFYLMNALVYVNIDPKPFWTNFLLHITIKFNRYYYRENMHFKSVEKCSFPYCNDGVLLRQIWWGLNTYHQLELSVGAHYYYSLVSASGMCKARFSNFN